MRGAWLATRAAQVAVKVLMARRVFRTKQVLSHICTRFTARAPQRQNTHTMIPVLLGFIRSLMEVRMHAAVREASTSPWVLLRIL